MDNAMVKRGIGAIVLAIIAALLLGWLLKDKSQERQDVVEMKLPGAPEMKIPSLTEPSPKEGSTSSVATLVNETAEKVTNTATDAGSKVVAAVTGTASKAKDAITSSTSAIEKTTKSSKPGFAIRPPNANEQREVVDNVNDAPATKNQNSSNEAKAGDTVVASTSAAPKKAKKAFVPSIVEEKKKVVKKKTAPKKVAKVAKQEKKKVVKVEKAKTVVTSAAPSGKYSVQLLATSSQSRANKLAQTMKEEGYKSFITQTSKNNKVLYRVRLGAHSKRSAALKAQQNLKRRYQKNFFVQNSLVVSN